MSKVIQLYPGGVVSKEQVEGVRQFEEAIILAIADAKALEIPQGFIVSLLHGHALQQTQQMLDNSPYYNEEEE